MANDKEYIRMLKERDEAKPLIKAEVILRSDGQPHGECPTCRYPILFTSFRFCPECGQHLDQTNWAL